MGGWGSVRATENRQMRLTGQQGKSDKAKSRLLRQDTGWEREKKSHNRLENRARGAAASTMHHCPPWGRCHGRSSAACEKWPRAGRDCQAWKLQDWRRVLHLRAPERQRLPCCFLGIYCTMASANRKIQMLLLWQNVPFFFFALLSSRSPLLRAAFSDFLIIPFHTCRTLEAIYRALQRLTLVLSGVGGVWGLCVRM